MKVKRRTPEEARAAHAASEARLALLDATEAEFPLREVAEERDGLRERHTDGTRIRFKCLDCGEKQWVTRAELNLLTHAPHCVACGGPCTETKTADHSFLEGNR
jgi:hypothetical protein